MKAAITTMALVLAISSPAFAKGPDGDEKGFFPDQRTTDIDAKGKLNSTAAQPSTEVQPVKDPPATGPGDKMAPPKGDTPIDRQSKDWDEKPFFKDQESREIDNKPQKPLINP